METIRDIFESIAEQILGKKCGSVDPGRLLIALAIFYLAEVLRGHRELEK